MRMESHTQKGPFTAGQVPLSKAAKLRPNLM